MATVTKQQDTTKYKKPASKTQINYDPEHVVGKPRIEKYTVDGSHTLHRMADLQVIKAKRFKSLLESEDREKQREEDSKQAIPFVVGDFRNVTAGTVVTVSYTHLTLPTTPYV